MANDFSKEEVVLFEQVIEGFDPNNITARQVSKFKPNAKAMERSSWHVWRPIPYIPIGIEGLVVTEYSNRTQLSVPTVLNAYDSPPSHFRNVPFTMNAIELHDSQQRDRIAQKAIQQLSATVDSVIATEVALRGSLFIKNGAPITKYEHVTQAEALMTTRDVPITSARTIIMNATDYNSVSANLANRDAPPTGVSLTAYERSMIPRIATFDSFKASFMPTIESTTASNYEVNGVNQDHDPSALTPDGKDNLDNRTQTLSVDTGTGAIQEGDAFTIAGVYAVSHIHKNVTPSLQTFRVTSTANVAGTQDITITPAIVVNGGGGGAQANVDYANCSTIPPDNAVLTFINIDVARPSNIFFVNDAVEITHGSLETMDLNAGGVSTMRSQTDSGIEIVMAKSSNIDDFSTKYRLTMWMTGNVLIPEMCGNLIQ